MTGLPVPNGWQVDADGWYWRKSRPNDPKIGKRSDVGFDDSTFPGTKPERKVFVRTPELAAMIDSGRITA